MALSSRLFQVERMLAYGFECMYAHVCLKAYGGTSVSVNRDMGLNALRMTADRQGHIAGGDPANMLPGRQLFLHCQRSANETSTEHLSCNEDSWSAHF